MADVHECKEKELRAAMINLMSATNWLIGFIEGSHPDYTIPIDIRDSLTHCHEVLHG